MTVLRLPVGMTSNLRRNLFSNPLIINSKRRKRRKRWIFSCFPLHAPILFSYWRGLYLRAQILITPIIHITSYYYI